MMSAEHGTQGVILQCLLRRTRARSLPMPRQTTNEWSSVERKRERGRGQEARARRIEQRIGRTRRTNSVSFFCDPKKLARRASELIALIVSQEKVGLGTSYSDTLRKKRGMWLSGPHDPLGVKGTEHKRATFHRRHQTWGEGKQFRWHRKCQMK